LHTFSPPSSSLLTLLSSSLDALDESHFNEGPRVLLDRNGWYQSNHKAALPTQFENVLAYHEKDDLTGWSSLQIDAGSEIYPFFHYGGHLLKKMNP